jgi:hypothetical protein
LARDRMLQQDAEQAAGENDAHDQRRPPDKNHRLPHSASIAPTRARAGRRVAYARSPRQPAPAFSRERDRLSRQAFTGSCMPLAARLGKAQNWKVYDSGISPLI